MAQVILKYVFATMLAFLTTQAVVPSVRIAPIEVVCGAASEQQIPEEVGRLRSYVKPQQSTQNAPTYESLTGPEPDFAALFQRPPPNSSLLS